MVQISRFPVVIGICEIGPILRFLKLKSSNQTKLDATWSSATPDVVMSLDLYNAQGLSAPCEQLLVWSACTKADSISFDGSISEPAVIVVGFCVCIACVVIHLIRHFCKMCLPFGLIHPPSTIHPGNFSITIEAISFQLKPNLHQSLWYVLLAVHELLRNNYALEVLVCRVKCPFPIRDVNYATVSNCI